MATHGSSDLPESAEIHPVGQVAADTHADNLRHAHLRAHFMNALLTDPRITELFDLWGKQTGLYRAADAVARAANDARVLEPAKMFLERTHASSSSHAFLRKRATPGES